MRDREVFDRAATPMQLTEDNYRAPNTLELLEERLTVNKDKIVAGLLQVGKHVITEPRSIDVQVTEEHTSSVRQ